MNFSEFMVLFEKNAKTMLENSQHLFLADVDKDALWDAYIESFSPEHNPMYRVRREYDCSCCKSFIRHFGNVVSIQNNKIVTLWDLSLEALDSIYTKLMASAKRSNEESLLKTRKSEDKLTDLKIEIVKHIFEVKQEEDEKRKLAVKNRQKKEFLKGILEQKQNEQILSKSAEEISAMIDSLGEVE